MVECKRDKRDRDGDVESIVGWRDGRVGGGVIKVRWFSKILHEREL